MQQASAVLRYRPLLMLALGALVAPLLSACGGDTATPTPVRPLAINGLFNLTGAMAGYDGPAAQGVQLAVDEVNAAGGIGGRKIEYLARDTATEPAKIANAADEAIKSGVVALIGFDDPDSVLSAAPIAQRAGVPFITVGATDPTLPTKAGDMTFLAAYGDNEQAAVGAEYLHNTLHATKVYVITNNGTEYTRGLSTYFQARWKTLEPGGLIGSDTYQVNDTEFSAQIGRMRALKTTPDALYLAAYPDELPKLIPALRSAGFTQPIMGGDAFDGAPILSLDGKPTGDVYYTTHGTLPAPAGSHMAEFAAAYKEKFGKDPDNIFAALGYDSARVLFDAIKRAPDLSGPALRKALEDTKNFAGATGDLSFGPAPNGHVPDKSVTVMKIQAGQAQLATQARAQTVPAP